MTHPEQTQQELSLSTSFTVTQFALGLPLQFEPAVGSKELDDLIEIYIPGPSTSQQKRAQVALEFFHTIETSCLAHPISLRYNVTRAIASPRNADFWPESNPTPSNTSTAPQYHFQGARPRTPKPSISLKRARIETPRSNSSQAKRLPGFSIMTRDGVDITEQASRGPKTSEQRAHAALMRRLKACVACKKSKQRCDPSHHRPMASALQNPTSVNTSSSSATPSSTSSIRGSRGSISPQSSLGDSFGESPAALFTPYPISYVGQEFSPLQTTKSISPPSNPALPDLTYADFDLSAIAMQDIDPELFQLVDFDFDTWDSEYLPLPSPNYTIPLNFQSRGHSKLQAEGHQRFPFEDKLDPQPGQYPSGRQTVKERGPLSNLEQSFGVQKQGQLGYQAKTRESYQAEDQLGYQSEGQLDYQSEGHLGYQSEGPWSYHSKDHWIYQSKGNDPGSYPGNPDPEKSKHHCQHAEGQTSSQKKSSSQNHSHSQEDVTTNLSQACLTLPCIFPESMARSTTRLPSKFQTHIPKNCTLGLSETIPIQYPNPARPLESIKSDQKSGSLIQWLHSNLKRSLGRYSDTENLAGMFMSLRLR